MNLSIFMVQKGLETQIKSYRTPIDLAIIFYWNRKIINASELAKSSGKHFIVAAFNISKVAKNIHISYFSYCTTELM